VEAVSPVSRGREVFQQNNLCPDDFYFASRNTDNASSFICPKYYIRKVAASCRDNSREQA
jgi:hypothetical protein